MTQKTCKLCDQPWETRNFGECPTCTEIREVDMKVDRAERLVSITNDDDSEVHMRAAQVVLLKADQADSRASSLEFVANLVSVLGILGSVIVGISAIVSDRDLGGFVLVVALGATLFWLLVRALCVAFALRLSLAAAVARLDASSDHDSL